MTLQPPRVREERRVVPRWRSSGATVEVGESNALREGTGPNREAVDKLEEDAAAFRDRPTTAFAADVVAGAVILNLPEVGFEAAEYLARNADIATPSSVRLARWLLGERDESLPSDERAPILDSRIGLDLEVHNLRVRLRDFPRDALAWTDLGRAYAALGEDDRAERATRIALALAPEHRVTLRAATRFLIHDRRGDEAGALLRGNPATPHDPWLVSVEISTSQIEGRPARFATLGKHMVRDGNFSDFHLSELAASLGTLELKQGGRARATRQLFERALRDPTENAIAQVQWAWLQDKERAPALEAEHLRGPHTHEALAYSAYAAGELELALGEYRAWVRDEPFSTSPMLHAAYLSALVSDEYQESITLMIRARRVRPDSHLIMNNLAYYFAMNGELEKAREVYWATSKEVAKGEDRVILEATGGLIAFASGRAVEGRAAYEEALRLIEHLPERRPYLEWLALTNLARAEYLYGNLERGLFALNRARKIIEPIAAKAPKAFMDRVSTLFATPRNLVQADRQVKLTEDPTR